MKKQFQFVLIAMAILLVAAVMSFRDPGKLTVTLTADQWNATLQVIEQSNAPHLQVQAVQQLIYPQLKEQSEAQAKTDSLKAKKP